MVVVIVIVIVVLVVAALVVVVVAVVGVEAVVPTISSKILFLHGKDGRIFYQGPVKNIVSHFSQFGYHCPSQYNPSDFIMTLTQAEATSVCNNAQLCLYLFYFTYAFVLMSRFWRKRKCS